MALDLQNGSALQEQDGTDLLLQADGGGPSITLQPASQTIDEGSPVTFTVTATGTGTLLYQWYETTAGLLVGEVAASLTFNTVAAEHLNGYYCVVTDDNGFATSTTATLSLNLVPVITTDPVSQTIVEGQDVTFTVVATGGAEPPTYQWYETTAGLLGGETGASLTFTTVLGDNGNGYYCIATNTQGTDTSTTAALTVGALPVISTQPVAVETVEQEPVVFTVVASGTGTVLYQWYETTAGLLVGETASTITFDATLADDGESYYVIVTDDIASVQSDTVGLIVHPLPIIVTEPSGITISDGDTAVFTVVATGEAPVTYQWYSVTNGIIAGQTSASTDFQGFYINQGEQFYVIVSDGFGGSVQSVAAAMTVAEPGLDFEADLNLKGPNGWIEILPRMKWRPNYTFGLTYFEEQVVVDGRYTMVANQTTAERADPNFGSTHWDQIAYDAPFPEQAEVELTGDLTPAQADDVRYVCTNAAPATLTLTGYNIGDKVVAIRTDALVTITTGDAALIDGQASQTLDSAYDVASLVFTLAGWIAV